MPCAIKRMCLKPRACAGLFYSPAHNRTTKNDPPDYSLIEREPLGHLSSGRNLLNRHVDIPPRLCLYVP